MAADRKQVFSRLHREWGYDEEILTASSRFRDRSIMKYLDGFPPGFVAKVPSLAKDVVDVGVNQIMAGETPSVRILLPPDAHRDAAIAKKHSEDLARKCQALLWYVETFGTETPFRGMIQHALGLGLGVLAYPILWQRWPDHPLQLKSGKTREGRNAAERAKVEKWQRTRTGLPIDVHAVHPRTALFDPDHDPIEDMIEEQLVSLGSFARDYPHLNLPERSTQKTAKLVTYCSAEEYGIWLNEKPLLLPKDGANAEGIAENTTGVLWYKIARGGFGDRTYKGEWDYAIKGILRDGRDMILGHITNYNVMEAIRQVYGFPEDDISGETLEQAQDEAPTSRGPSARWLHSSKVKRNIPQTPPVPQVVFQQLERQDEELGIHFGPYGDALRGIYQAETASGLRTRISLGKSPYRAAKQSTEQAASAFLMDVFYYVKKVLREPISFPGRDAIVTIRPDDIPDGARAVVDWAPPTPEEKGFELQDLLQKKEKDAASVRRILELDDDVDDVDEELANILADKTLAMPETLQMVSQMALADFQKRTGQPEQSTVPAVGADGFTPPGAQPPPPVLGGPQDMAQQQAGYFEPLLPRTS